MYYYYIDGYTITSELVSSEDADEGTIYTKAETTKPIKRALSLSQMLDYFNEGTPVYISYDDEDGNVTEDALVTQDYVNSIEGITATTTEEELVGSDGTTTTQTVTTYSVNRSYDPTNYNIEISTVSFTVDSIPANGRYSTTFTPNMTGYTLLGVVGWNLTGGASAIVPYQLYVDNGTLYVSLRNTYSGSSINNFGFTVHLMWRVDRVELINLETEVEEEELV